MAAAAAATADTVTYYKFVISSHGVIIPKEPSYDIPVNTRVHTHMPGATIRCEPKLQTHICKGIAGGFSHHYMGPRADVGVWGNRNKLLRNVKDINSGFDIALTRDTTGAFKSGLVLCKDTGADQIIYDIDTRGPTTLTTLIDTAFAHVRALHDHLNFIIDIYLLACLEEPGGPAIDLNSRTGKPISRPDGSGGAASSTRRGGRRDRRHRKMHRRQTRRRPRSKKN